MPKVSVIVPNYNHAPYLKQRIDSILNQTYQDFELILLDDCSTDNSVEVLNEYKSHPKVSHCVFNDINSGSTFKQWDKGISLASGEYIWIAESDDRADERFLETIVDEAARYPEAGLFFTASQLIDSNDTVTYENNQDSGAKTIVYDGFSFIRKKMSTTNAIWNASMVVFKRTLYPKESSDLFTVMKYCGDWFFYVLLAEKTSVVEIKQSLNFFRIHSQNVSTEAERTGKSFTEGLIVYNYIANRYLSLTDRLKSSVEWGRRLYKFRKKYSLTDNEFAAITNTVKANNRSIYVNYLIYKLLKSL